MERTFLEGLVNDPAAVDAILQEHGRIVDAMEFRNTLQQAVQAAGGRNYTAIAALLDQESLLQSQNRQEAVQAALRGLKRESPYLFAGTVEQPYAGGTAAAVTGSYTMEDVGAMSMEEYRRFRKG